MSQRKRSSGPGKRSVKYIRDPPLSVRTLSTPSEHFGQNTLDGLLPLLNDPGRFEIYKICNFSCKLPNALQFSRLAVSLQAWQFLSLRQHVEGAHHECRLQNKTSKQKGIWLQWTNGNQNYTRGSATNFKSGMQLRCQSLAKKSAIFHGFLPAKNQQLRHGTCLLDLLHQLIQHWPSKLNSSHFRCVGLNEIVDAGHPAFIIGVSTLYKNPWDVQRARAAFFDHHEAVGRILRFCPAPSAWPHIQRCSNYQLSSRENADQPRLPNRETSSPMKQWFLMLSARELNAM